MRLDQILEEAKQRFTVNTAEEVHGAMFRMIRDQQQSGMAYGLEVGHKAIDFTLNNPFGVI